MTPTEKLYRKEKKIEELSVIKHLREGLNKDPHHVVMTAEQVISKVLDPNMILKSSFLRLFIDKCPIEDLGELMGVIETEVLGDAPSLREAVDTLLHERNEREMDKCSTLDQPLLLTVDGKLTNDQHSL